MSTNSQFDAPPSRARMLRNAVDNTKKSVPSVGIPTDEANFEQRIAALERENADLRKLLYPERPLFSDALRLTKMQHVVMSFLLTHSPSYVSAAAIAALFPRVRDSSFAYLMISRLRAKAIRAGVAIDHQHGRGYRLTVIAARALRSLEAS